MLVKGATVNVILVGSIFHVQPRVCSKYTCDFLLIVARNELECMVGCLSDRLYIWDGGCLLKWYLNRIYTNYTFLFLNAQTGLLKAFWLPPCQCKWVIVPAILQRYTHYSRKAYTAIWKRTECQDCNKTLRPRLTWYCHQMEHLLRYWPFMRGIHRWQVNSPHEGQWRGALMFSLICGWINGWVNNRAAGDLRRRRAHYDIIVMSFPRHASCFDIEIF